MVQPNLRKYQILTWVKMMNDGWGTRRRPFGDSTDYPPTITNITAHIAYNNGFKNITSNNHRREETFIEAKSNVSRYVNKYVQDYLLKYSVTKVKKTKNNHLDVKKQWNTGGRTVRKLELTDGENCGGVNKRKYLIKEMNDRILIGRELNKLAKVNHSNKKEEIKKSKKILGDERGESTQKRFTDIIRRVDCEEFDGVRKEEVILPKGSRGARTKGFVVHDIDSVEN